MLNCRAYVLPLCMVLTVISVPSGCDNGPRSPATKSASIAPAATAPSAEPAWHDQIAAVRARTETRISVRHSRVTAVEMQDLATGCAVLEVLDLEDVEVATQSLAVLEQLPALARLKLGGPVDDAAVEQIVTCVGLTAVNLPQATFTDHGLERLATLPRLELLRFHSSNVTDDGLQEIARMPSLRFLHLIDVPVTDAGLIHLHGMGRLESLYLDGGTCTEAGLRSLLTALPELHFHRDQLHLPGDPRADEHGPALPTSAMP
ncbi:MAG: hypothetical protein U0992_23185 [Planctomycetaceae bacterium]